MRLNCILHFGKISLKSFKILLKTLLCSLEFKTKKFQRNYILLLAKFLFKAYLLCSLDFQKVRLGLR